MDLLDMDVSCERDWHSYLKFYMKKGGLHIYRMVLSKLGFIEKVTDFGNIISSRCLRASRRVNGRIQHRKVCFLFHIRYI